MHKRAAKQILLSAFCILLLVSCSSLNPDAVPPSIETSVPPSATIAPPATPLPTQTPTKKPTPLPTPVGPIEISANPGKGFNWPYLLYVPSKISGENILVVPNNSGNRYNDFSVHENRAKDTISDKISWAEKLEVPLLVPIFPRFDDNSDGTIASQYLGRGSLEKIWQNRYPDISREDLQIIAMIDDARERLRSLDIEVNEKVFIEGYSASAMFTSRFTILHPDRVQASAFGGHGWAIVPIDKWENLSIPYPYGTADIQALTGQPFNLDEFKRVPILSYMGELDDNGWAFPWYMGEGYNPSGYYSYFKTVFGSSAQDMSDSASQIYQSLGCNATFVVYKNQDHQSAYSHDNEIIAFFNQNK